MSTSLFDLSVKSFIQVVEASTGVLAKGKAYCEEQNIDLASVVETKIIADMADFHFQVVCITHQSVRAIHALRSGEFNPPAGYARMDYQGLMDLTQASLDELKAMSEDEINGLAGGTVTFKMGKFEVPFTTENFILSFSHPNLYFHATTTYDILRMQGTPLGKMDFLGAMRAGV